MPSIEQWFSTCSQFSVNERDPLVALYQDMISRYQATNRSYHNEQHLDECFACFKDVRAESQHPAEIEMAIWFHDAIYDSKRKDNEELSAEWALRETIRFGVSRESAERIHSLILDTKHQFTPVTQDAEILVDVDLAILGSEPGRFDQYEKQVREEYSWVPGFVFRRKRRQLLEDMLGRQSIYATALFRERYEQRARDNIRRSLDRL